MVRDVDVFLQALEVDFPSRVQDIESAILEDVSYFVGTSSSSNEFSGSSFRD